MLTVHFPTCQALHSGWFVPNCKHQKTLVIWTNWERIKPKLLKSPHKEGQQEGKAHLFLSRWELGYDWKTEVSRDLFPWHKQKSESCSVVSNSLQPHGLWSPWNSLGQNTGVGSLCPLQGIFPTQGSNPGLPYCRQILYQLSHKGSTWTLRHKGSTRRDYLINEHIK